MDKSLRALGVLLVAATLAACGGGETDRLMAPLSSSASIPISQGPSAARQILPTALVAPTADSLYGGVSPTDAVNQLFDNVAEKAYPWFFPGHKATIASGPWLFRFYPETGAYVGVAVNVASGDGLTPSGVYVMGGPFGATPLNTGKVLLEFITPTAGQTLVATIAEYNGDTVLIVNGVPVTPTNNTTLVTPRCGVLPTEPLAWGKVLELCYVFFDNTPRYAVHDLVTNVRSDFTDTPPPGYEASAAAIGPKWHVCQTNCQFLTGNWGTKPAVLPVASAWAPKLSLDGTVTGWIWADDTDNRILRSADASGGNVTTTFTSPIGGTFLMFETMICDATQCQLRTN